MAISHAFTNFDECIYVGSIYVQLQDYPLYVILIDIFLGYANLVGFVVISLLQYFVYYL